jgi:hypothetical protein
MSGVLRFLPWFFVLVGGAMLVAAGVSCYRQAELVRDGHVVLGSVAQNVLIPAHRYTDSKGSSRFAPDAYAPQIQFVADDGRQHAFVLGRSSSAPEYAVGERVELIYPPGHPDDALLNQFEAIWDDTLTFAILGSSFLVIGVAHAVLQRRQARRAEQDRRRVAGGVNASHVR